MADAAFSIPSPGGENPPATGSPVRRKGGAEIRCQARGRHPGQTLESGFFDLLKNHEKPLESHIIKTFGSGSDSGPRLMARGIRAFGNRRELVNRRYLIKFKKLS